MNSNPSAPHDLQTAVAMMGARRHYAVPQILQNTGVLNRFFTDIHSDE